MRIDQLKTVIEPDITFEDGPQLAFVASIAISLKRLADFVQRYEEAALSYPQPDEEEQRIGR